MLYKLSKLSLINWLIVGIVFTFSLFIGCSAEPEKIKKSKKITVSITGKYVISCYENSDYRPKFWFYYSNGMSKSVSHEEFTKYEVSDTVNITINGE